MNWKVAETLIRQRILTGTTLDRRTVQDGPDYPCKGYDYKGTPGFKVKIGKTTTIEIPFIMLQAVYEGAIVNNRIYDNKVFKSKYERQFKSHGCHVHVIGSLFEKAGVATQIDKRKYKLI